MSGKTFKMLRTMDQNEVQLQIVLQCAPLLMGVKISNLLTVLYEQKEYVLELFSQTAVSCCVLYESEQKVILLLYVEEDLERYLCQQKVKDMMNSFGYRGMLLSEMFFEVSKRYSTYMEKRQGFPHEIGLLLGYPPEDVAGFIEHQGKKFLYTGYWKVYGNVKESVKVFESFDKAKESAVQMLGAGIHVLDILQGYSANQSYKERTA